MAVTGTGVRVEFVTDGATVMFSYPNYLFQFSDLIATWTPNSTGLPVRLILNSDYTLADPNTDEFGAHPQGADLTTMGATSPFPAGLLVLDRRTEQTQLVEYIDDDSFPATSHEHALDKLTLMIQEITPLRGMSTLSVGPIAMTAGQVLTASVNVIGAMPGMVVEVSPLTDPGSGFTWDGLVLINNVATMRVTCITAGTFPATLFNARVFP